jgi:hypothetical protein
MRRWTQQYQIRKVKLFLREALMDLPKVRSGIIHPPDWMNTPRERRVMYHQWYQRMADLRVALIKEVELGRV